MKNENELKSGNDLKRNISGRIIVFIIIAISGGIGVIGWSNLSREHNEAKNLTLNTVDFNRLNDGIYTGRYEGGMYKWRESEVWITIHSGNITKIELIKNKENQPPEFTDKLFNTVIEKQSLQIDAISGATLTSKAYLQAIENALINAQK